MTKIEVMMQVEEMVTAYKKGAVEMVGDIYIEMMKNFFNPRKWVDANKLGDNTGNEVQSIYNDVFMKALEKFEPGRGYFVKYTIGILNNAIIDAARKQSTIKKHESSMENYVGKAKEESEGGNSFEEWNIVEDFNRKAVPTPEDFIDMFDGELSVDAKIAKMREVVNDILRKCDDFQMQVLEMKLAGKTYREIAAALGTNRMKVQRAFDKIQKLYDADKYGEHDALYTVNVVKSRR